MTSQTNPASKNRSPHKNHGSAVSANILRNIGANVVSPLAALAVAPLLAHALGVAGRGEVAAATAPYLLMAVLATLGLPDAITYVTSRSSAAMKLAIRNSAVLLLLTGIAGTVAVYIASPILSGGDPDLQSLLLLASIAIVPTTMIGALRSAAGGLGRWTLVAFEKSLVPVVRLLAMLLLAVTGNLDVLTATIVVAFSPIVGVFCYIPLLFHKAEIDERFGFEEWRTPFLFKYGSRVWIGAIAGMLLMRLDQTLMTPLSSAYELGLYAVAVSISEIPLLINTAIRDVIFAADAKDSIDARLGMASRVSTFGCAIFGLGIGVTMPWWLPWLFGADFAPAVPITEVLLIAVVLGTPGSVAGAGLSARGKPGKRSTSLVVACLINVIALFILVPPFGAMGAAVATLIGNVISNTLNIYFLKRLSGTTMLMFFGLRKSDIKFLKGLAFRMMGKVRVIGRLGKRANA